MQEESLHRMQSDQQKHAGETGMLEHQVEQYKMRINELGAQVSDQRNNLKRVSFQRDRELSDLQS